MTWDGLAPPYATIVADPPWEYDEGFPRGTTSRANRATVRLPYSAMSLDEIAALPIAELAAPDCWLFLWTTNKYLRASFDLVDGWGFRYTQTLTWRKTGCPPPFVRSIAPQHSEFLIVAKRGKPQRVGALPSSVVDGAASPRAHSAKPEIFGDLIESVCPGPRVELFCRRQRFGWDTWGYGYEEAAS